MKHENYWRKISENTDNWDLDKGNEPAMEFHYKCVEIFSISDQFKDMSERFTLVTHNVRYAFHH
jgi:hypothetical protein